MNSYESSQESIRLITFLAQVASTPGINEETQKLINEQIQTLIKSNVSKTVQELGLNGSGIITKLQ